MKHPNHGNSTFKTTNSYLFSSVQLKNISEYSGVDSPVLYSPVTVYSIGPVKVTSTGDVRWDEVQDSVCSE